MNRKVLVIFGVSGVGKTTLLNRATDRVDFLHLQASELIKREFETEKSECKTSEELRTGDIEHNQTKLARGFAKSAKEVQGTIVLDGHSVIDTSDGLVFIEPYEIEPLKPSCIVFLSESPETIFHRRLSDQSRVRPSRTAREIGLHQAQALEQAKKIADRLDIPIVSIGSSNLEELVSLLR